MKDNTNQNKGFEWSKFAGLASQWAVALFVLLFSGRYLDQKHFLKMNTPIFIWLLPFLFIIFSLHRIVKDTNSKS